jgi:hypothetical protein
MTIRQRWKQTALHNKLLVIIGGLSVTALVATPIVQAFLDELHRREDRRPVVINNRPPELLHPFTCDPKTGFHSGNIQVFAKNTGKTNAINVFPMLWTKIIPEKKTGIPVCDEYLPSVNCSLKIDKSPMSFLLPADGREYGLQIRQSVGTLPPITETEPVQLYVISFLYYQDSDETDHHAACDAYILNFPSTNPLDKFFGSPTFVCDGNDKIGKLTGALSGHCAN